MTARHLRRLVALIASTFASVTVASDGVELRIATFNLEDVRTQDLADPDNERLRGIAEIIQRIRPNVILLNEIAYDTPGAPGVPEDAEAGRNAQRFVRTFLATPQAPGLDPLSYHAFMAKPNTGFPSGFDLDRSGEIVVSLPEGDVQDAGRSYAGDAWGFGTFPGQYGMALLVDARLEILEDQIRTFRLFPWAYMPGALRPMFPGTTEPWYAGEVGERVRLSSKSHWDVPIQLPGGGRLHVLCAHPTPPAFDGPEGRNKRRNHDEIRFWADYIEDAEYIIDDAGVPGGLDDGASFVIVGDLNADPDEGSSMYDPIGRLLLASPRLAHDAAPEGDLEIAGLDSDDTARFGLRVDYVLPSADIAVTRAGVWRTPPTLGGSEPTPRFPSDHFPVWADVVVPSDNASSD